MKFGSVCSGIEAASVAWNKLKWSASWLAEIEPFPSAVLAHHYPDVPNLGDMTQLPEKILSGEIEAPDIFCGGTPCQAFSIAGNRNSLDDARGNLSLTFCEIADAIDSVRSIPSVIFWENVPGVLNTKDNAFGCFLAGLAGEDGELKPSGKKWTNAGMVLGPKRAVAWRVLDAQYFGLAQRRKRVFVVASARNGFNPAEVLFEFDGLRRDTAPGRNKGETITTNVEESVGNHGKLTSFTPCSFAQYKEGVGTLRANGGDLGGGSESLITTYNKQRIGEYSTEDVASTCAARDYKDATDLIVNVIPLNTMTMLGRPSDDLKPRMGSGIGLETDPSPTITKAHSHAVAYNITFCDANGTRKDRPDGGLYVNETNVTNTLTNAGVGTNVVHTMFDVAGPLDASYYKGQGSRQGGEREFVAQSFAQNQLGECRVGDVFNTLNTNSNASGRNTPMLMTQMAVRRLTPTECERLQGFPDGYTQIPWRNKSAEDCPDGPRYKALGNSWAVPVVAWIGERIAKEVAK
jgi:DNA (cytosine-5)-methyltransferase 1